MYGEQNLPNLTPLMPIASLGMAPYGHPLTSFASISSLAQPMMPSAQSGSSLSANPGSSYMSPLISSQRTVENENSNCSTSPARDECETSSTSSSESTPSSMGSEGMNTKDKKRKGSVKFSCQTGT